MFVTIFRGSTILVLHHKGEGHSGGSSGEGSHLLNPLLLPSATFHITRQYRAMNWPTSWHGRDRSQDSTSGLWIFGGILTWIFNTRAGVWTWGYVYPWGVRVLLGGTRKFLHNNNHVVDLMKGWTAPVSHCAKNRPIWSILCNHILSVAAC